MSFRFKTRRRTAVLAVLVSASGLALAVGQQPANADVTTVEGEAFGYMLNLSLFGGPVSTRGHGQVACTATGTPPGCAPNPETSSSPRVELPAIGGNLSQTDPDGTRGVVGPAVLFSAGQMDVRTQGAAGPTGSVTSSANLAEVGRSGFESFTANNLASSCTASEAGVSGSTTIVGGMLQTDTGDTDPDNEIPDHPPVDVALPVNPAPNTTYPGHLHIGDLTDNFEWVFNEQVRSEGSLTVYAAHQRILGPLAVGDLYIGKSHCGVTAVVPPTTVPPTTVPPTTVPPTTVPPTTVPPHCLPGQNLCISIAALVQRIIAIVLRLLRFGS